MDCDSHSSLCSLDQTSKAIKSFQRLVKARRVFVLRLIVRSMRHNGHTAASFWCAAEDDLGWESCAEITLDGKRDTGYSFLFGPRGQPVGIILGPQPGEEDDVNPPRQKTFQMTGHHRL